MRSIYVVYGHVLCTQMPYVRAPYTRSVCVCRHRVCTRYVCIYTLRGHTLCAHACCIVVGTRLPETPGQRRLPGAEIVQVKTAVLCYIGNEIWRAIGP